MTTLPYNHWSKEELIKRIQGSPSSEAGVESFPPAEEKRRTGKQQKPFIFSNYPTRKTALRFAYHGAHYNGLTYQPHPTPLPTVESVLFNALVKCRLIDPDKGYEGCDWSRCGRTDKGVSAAGQVVSLYLRSNLVERNVSMPPEQDDSNKPSTSSSASPQGITELNYPSLLNNVLPPTIRILAYSPASPAFSARFSTLSRHYKYFFVPSSSYDLGAMKEACKLLEGEHDWRNFCKIDPSKQIDNHVRRVLSASISEVGEEMWVFDLVGTAFLWNQVRHIMAILFSIGARLEPPSLVTSLLAVEGENGVTKKPIYEIADPLPLVLWDCKYSDEDVRWIYPEGVGGGGRESLMEEMRGVWERDAITASISDLFIRSFLSSAPSPPTPTPPPLLPETQRLPAQRIDLGGGTYRGLTKRGGGSSYIPILQRERLSLTVEDMNERWRVNGGLKKREEKRERREKEKDRENGGDE